ncbi:fused DSP-PTPase phosphatase/NAD kinase-like protein [Acuticoccus sp.]|uniref:phosphatase domain-containing protein n=1 Tax=Acuticoccus sp. TaxID=1904378 RepID=UPI003B51B433
MPLSEAIARWRKPAVRARRHARATRWQQPIASAADRRAAWASLMLADHGVLRLLYRNRHRVTDRLWRSAQPSPGDIAWAARAGIATVLSVRAEGFGGDPLEREACRRQGLAFERLVLQSRAAPTREALTVAIALMPRLATPVLVHCKSGADRAGLATALWLIVVEGRTVAEAKRQLALRYGHVRRARTGILDAFLDDYAATGEARGIAFADWVRTVYDRQALKARFRSSRAADALLAVLNRE